MRSAVNGRPTVTPCVLEAVTVEFDVESLDLERRDGETLELRGSVSSEAWLDSP